MLTILDPVAAPRDAMGKALPLLADLQGRTVAILTNHWKSMDHMALCMAQRLKQRYHVADVRLYDIPINGAMAESVKQRALAECDAAIVGLAN